VLITPWLLWELAHTVLKTESSWSAGCKLEPQESDGVVQAESEGLRTGEPRVLIPTAKNEMRC
jgi:hypothetical protein